MYGGRGTVQPTQLEIAWAAGFFDGEGCVQINLNRPKALGGHVPTFSLKCTVAQTYEKPVRDLAAWWGGTVQDRPANKEKNARRIWVWHIASRAALKFLEDVRPYLLVKADQADIGMEFQRGMQHTRKGQPRSLTETVRQAQAFENVRKLNKRGAKRRTFKHQLDDLAEALNPGPDIEGE